jgi:hypothetical protein
MLGNVVFNAYDALILWDLTYDLISNLAALREKHSDLISADKPFLGNYQKAIRSFIYFLGRMADALLWNLKNSIPASPPLRSLWVQEP